LSNHFTLPLHVSIRPCRETDLLDLEWFGRLTDFRQTIADAFKRSQQGEVIMLVAEANCFPVGQIWIDLTMRRTEAIGVLWALRVFKPFQNIGIGSRLLASAEKILKDKDFTTAEIGVEKDNLEARRLYERMGYQVIKDNVEAWGYTTPEGKQVHETIIEWIMHKRLGT
jgi:ribosomal protein S18 acetylase RimI-like enzyme